MWTGATIVSSVSLKDNPPPSLSASQRSNWAQGMDGLENASTSFMLNGGTNGSNPAYQQLAAQQLQQALPHVQALSGSIHC